MGIYEYLNIWVQRYPYIFLEFKKVRFAHEYFATTRLYYDISKLSGAVGSNPYTPGGGLLNE